MEDVKVLHDLAYARVDDKVLLLDLYLPQNAAGSLPVIVWIHGGAYIRKRKRNAGHSLGSS